MTNAQSAARTAGKLIVLTSHPIQYQAPLWREMAKAGINFEVCFLTDQGVRHTEDKDFGRAFAWDVDLLSGYPHRFLELRGAWDIKKFNGVPLAKPIAESLRELGANAVWIEGWRLKPFWDAAFAAKRAGLQVLLRAETSDKIRERGGAFGLFRKWALWRLFSRVDHFLVIGQACRRFYRSYGVPEVKMLDAPYAVNNEFFRAEAGKVRGQPVVSGPNSPRSRVAAAGENGATRGSIRKEWNIPLEVKVVMFCGKFVRKKRPLDVVEAVRLLAGKAEKLQSGTAESGQYHLLFVGSGELGDELRAACDVRFDADCQNGKISRSQNAGAPPASFAGFLNQSQISKAYAAADVMVLPSEAWETWGLVVNEATAAGVPTVIGDQCGCADDFAAKNPYSRIFPTGDVAALARSIEDVLALDVDPSTVSQYAEEFSLAKTVKAVADALAAGV